MHEPNAEQIVQHLKGKRSGNQWKAKCPCHDDKVESLTISVKDGKVLVHCHAGCSQDAVLDYFKDEGLWPRSNGANGHANGNGTTHWFIETTYDYLDADGDLVFKIDRHYPKDFRARRPNGNGGWIKNLHGVKPIPYRLPEIAEAIERGQPVFVVEGEKDADNLAKLGIVATCNATGAGKWKSEHAAYLKGADVVILPDNDEPGRQHAEFVAVSLVGIARRIRVLTLPDLPYKGDVSDWLDKGGTPEQLSALVKGAPDWKANDKAKGKADPKDRPSWREAATTAAQLQREKFPPVSWVVPALIPEGLTLLAGKPKIGKSWLALDLCLGVAGNVSVMGGIRPQHGDVLYCALEDNQRRLQKRMSKLSSPGAAWPERLTLATSWQRLDQGGVDDIAQWADSVPAARLVVLDTLAGVRPVRGRDGYTEDYDALAAVHRLANDRGFGVLVLHHTRKMDAEDPVDMVSGTLGLSGCADTVMVLNRTGQGTTLYGRGRDIEEFERAAEFNKEACCWRLLGDAEDVRRSDTRKAILAALAEAGEGATMAPKEIADATGKSAELVRQTLYRMAHVGEVVKTGHGRYRPQKEFP